VQSALVENFRVDVVGAEGLRRWRAASDVAHLLDPPACV
jgi:hypothetical protein